MATDRADLAVVKRIVYDNLGVTNQSSGYGNLQTNERYLSGYIDDAIAIADIQVMKLLLKQKQYHLMGEYWTTLAIPNGLRMNLPENDAILGVYYYTTTGGADSKAIPVSKNVFDLISEGAKFDIVNYGGYYTIQDGEIQLIGDETYNSGNSYTFAVDVLPNTFAASTAHGWSANTAVVLSSTGTLPPPFVTGQTYYIRNPSNEFFELSDTSGGTSITIEDVGTGVHTVQQLNQAYGYIKYIKLDHPSSLSSLYSPENFEGAIASYATSYLLMKRGDDPNGANFHMGMYEKQMQGALGPINDMQHNIEAQ